MRGGVEGLANPLPIGAALPALFQEHDFIQRWSAALDETLSPAHATLDNLSAYLDPYITPIDFLPWLGSWVGVDVDPTWVEARQRAMVGDSVQIVRLRGTRQALARHLELVTGATVEVRDSGGTRWSQEPGAALPGSPAALVEVVVTAPGADVALAQHVEAIVASAKPAHVAHRVEVYATEAPT